MGLNPTVRVVEEGSGDILYVLPPFTSLPSSDDELVMSHDGGIQTTYKVEKIQHVLDIVNQDPGPGGAVSEHAGGTVDIIVSVP